MAGVRVSSKAKVEEQVFFFEKKNQKTFASWHARPNSELVACAK
jgi:hypothetical protein